MNTRKRLHCSCKTGAHYAVKTEAARREARLQITRTYGTAMCKNCRRCEDERGGSCFQMGSRGSDANRTSGMWRKPKFVSHERLLSASYQIHEAERMNILQIGEGITDDQEDSGLDADGKLMPLDGKRESPTSSFCQGWQRWWHRWLTQWQRTWIFSWQSLSINWWD